MDNFSCFINEGKFTFLIQVFIRKTFLMCLNLAMNEFLTIHFYAIGFNNTCLYVQMCEHYIRFYTILVFNESLKNSVASNT